MQSAVIPFHNPIPYLLILSAQGEHTRWPSLVCMASRGIFLQQTHNKPRRSDPPSTSSAVYPIFILSSSWFEEMNVFDGSTLLSEVGAIRDSPKFLPLIECGPSVSSSPWFDLPTWSATQILLYMIRYVQFCWMLGCVLIESKEIPVFNTRGEVLIWVANLMIYSGMFDRYFSREITLPNPKVNHKRWTHHAFRFHSETLVLEWDWELSSRPFLSPLSLLGAGWRLVSLASPFRRYSILTNGRLQQNKMADQGSARQTRWRHSGGSAWVSL